MIFFLKKLGEVFRRNLLHVATPNQYLRGLSKYCFWILTVSIFRENAMSYKLVTVTLLSIRELLIKNLTRPTSNFLLEMIIGC